MSLSPPKIEFTGAWKYTPETSDRSTYLCKNTAQIIANTVLKKSFSSRLIDMGCSTGYYLAYMENVFENKLELIGVEPLVDTETKTHFNRILNQDLTIPFNIAPGNVMCLEVLEHIPKKYEKIAVENIVNNCNDFLFMSWAKVGQNGHGHINCKDKKDVVSLFEGYGFFVQEDLTKDLCKSARLSWLKDNLLCLRKTSNS
jgi:hypothetical protein